MNSLSIKERLIRSDFFKYLRLMLGFVAGVINTFVTAPLLHWGLYKDIPTTIELSFYVASVVALALLAYYMPKPFALSRKEVRKYIFIGISAASFIIGFITFIEYPCIVASDYSWLTEGLDIHFLSPYVPTGRPFIDATLGGLIFFIASILWDGLTGSFFAVLEHLLT